MIPSKILSESDTLHRTTILISNLDCPSCVTRIQALLATIEPRPKSIAPSIVSQSVTVLHSSDVSLDALEEKLKEGGYEVFGNVSESMEEG
jgi:Cu+-exporting ATPase